MSVLKYKTRTWTLFLITSSWGCFANYIIIIEQKLQSQKFVEKKSQKCIEQKLQRLLWEEF